MSGRPAIGRIFLFFTRKIKSRSVPVGKAPRGPARTSPPKEPVVTSPPMGPAKRKKDVPKKAPAHRPGKRDPVSKKGQKSVMKGSMTYEVRVDGMVEGSFSSKAKAEALKKQLKTGGKKARIFVVFI